VVLTQLFPSLQECAALPNSDSRKGAGYVDDEQNVEEYDNRTMVCPYM
jgi:hypothetical protein